MTDMSTDTTTPATDRELVEIETKARASTVMHWPELVRLINRLRVAERERDEAGRWSAEWHGRMVKAESDLTAARARIALLTKLVERAYNEAFSEGMKEHTHFNGGKSWSESRARSLLGEQADSSIGGNT